MRKNHQSHVYAYRLRIWYLTNVAVEIAVGEPPFSKNDFWFPGGIVAIQSEVMLKKLCSYTTYREYLIVGQ